MALYALGDLHLSFGVPDKSMDRFGKAWVGHEKKIRENWLATVKEDDTIVLTGDFSWGKNDADLAPDFDFLFSLPGRKIMLRGNHDMFWDAKKTARLNERFGPKAFFLQDNFAEYGEVALVGTKGICFENLGSFEHFRSLEEREAERLKKSFDAAKAAGMKRFIVFLHYPPTSSIWPPTPELCKALGMSRQEERQIRAQEEKILARNRGVPKGGMPVFDIRAMTPAMIRKTEHVVEYLHSPFTDLAEENGAEQVIYSHSHGKSRFGDSLHGNVRGIHYQLVSGDYLDFQPYKVLD